MTEALLAVGGTLGNSEIPKSFAIAQVILNL